MSNSCIQNLSLCKMLGSKAKVPVVRTKNKTRKTDSNATSQCAFFFFVSNFIHCIKYHFQKYVDSFAGIIPFGAR